MIEDVALGFLTKQLPTFWRLVKFDCLTP